MEKAGHVITVILGIILSICAVYLFMSIYDSNKERKIRHEKMLDSINNMSDIYTMTKDGIASGELKVAVITNEGILFSKEVKPKTKKHGRK